jgi:PEP-CTERM motif
MKKIVVAGLASLFVLPTLVRSAHAQTPLIEATIGAGAKTAYLVIDFKNSNSFTFAYQYNGSNVTAGDMIAAIDTSMTNFDSNLGGTRNSGFGRFVNGLGYKTNLLSSFTANFNTPPYFGWNYYISTDSLSNPTPAWSESPLGVDGTDGVTLAGFSQNLDTHPWNGFSWGQYDENTFAFLGLFPNVNTTAAIPEPTTLVLFGLGGVLGVARRRRRF